MNIEVLQVASSRLAATLERSTLKKVDPFLRAIAISAIRPRYRTVAEQHAPTHVKHVALHPDEGPSSTGESGAFYWRRPGEPEGPLREPLPPGNACRALHESRSDNLALQLAAYNSKHNCPNSGWGWSPRYQQRSS